MRIIPQEIIVKMYKKETERESNIKFQHLFCIMSNKQCVEESKEPVVHLRHSFLNNQRRNQHRHTMIRWHDDTMTGTHLSSYWINRIKIISSFNDTSESLFKMLMSTSNTQVGKLTEDFSCKFTDCLPACHFVIIFFFGCGWWIIVFCIGWIKVGY